MPPLSAIAHFEQSVPIQTVDDFKRRTLRKLEGVRCPTHRQPPRVDFRGHTLQTVTIQMSGCCDALIALANQRIAAR